MLCRKWPPKKGSSAKASYIFLVHRLVWKILLIPHICAGAAFRLGIFNWSRPQQGIPSPLFQFIILVSSGSLCVFQKPQFGNWVSTFATETFRRKRGRQLLLKYQSHCKVLGWEWVGLKGSELNDNMVVFKIGRAHV